MAQGAGAGLFGQTGPAVATVDAVAVKAVVVGLRRGAGLFGALAIVGDERREERDVADLVIVARRAAGRHGVLVRGLERHLQAAGRVTPRADVGAEHHVPAGGAGDLVDPVDELLTVVDPRDFADRLCAHERHRAVHVGPEGELPPPAVRAASLDQARQPRFVEESYGYAVSHTC